MLFLQHHAHFVLELVRQFHRPDLEAFSPFTYLFGPHRIHHIAEFLDFIVRITVRSTSCKPVKVFVLKIDCLPGHCVCQTLLLADCMLAAADVAVCVSAVLRIDIPADRVSSLSACIVHQTDQDKQYTYANYAYVFHCGFMFIPQI